MSFEQRYYFKTTQFRLCPLCLARVSMYLRFYADTAEALRPDQLGAPIGSATYVHTCSFHCPSCNLRMACDSPPGSAFAHVKHRDEEIYQEFKQDWSVYLFCPDFGTRKLTHLRCIPLLGFSLRTLLNTGLYSFAPDITKEYREWSQTGWLECFNSFEQLVQA